MGRWITEELTLWAVDRPQFPVSAVLSYRAADPLALRLTLARDGRETSAYVFARALLEEGLWGPCGEGTVMVGPHEAPGWLVITLQPAQGYPFALYAERTRIKKILDKTYRLVPMSGERVDVDACIQRILGLGEVTS